MSKLIARVGELLHAAGEHLSFNILEIGALPVTAGREPFYALLDAFPGSRICAFEVDRDVCDRLNAEAVPGVRYYPVALGRREEQRPFYETRHPMCSSLYRPNERLIQRYNNMEVAMLKAVRTIETVSLDHFVAEHEIEPVDFVKIDIQGAELDVFRGGTSTISNVLAIVSEVEFVHHYEDQPLFGDVCAFLLEQNIGFHKFLGVAGRCLKPVILNNNPNLPSQQMWSDAVFLREHGDWSVFSDDQLLKTSILALLYGSVDVCIVCFQAFDARRGSDLTSRMMKVVAKGGGERAAAVANAKET